MRARRSQAFRASHRRNAYRHLNIARLRRRRQLSSAQEVDDEDDQQHDHQDPDQSITCPCDSERQRFLLRRFAGCSFPRFTCAPNLTTAFEAAPMAQHPCGGRSRDLAHTSQPDGRQPRAPFMLQPRRGPRSERPTATGPPFVSASQPSCSGVWSDCGEDGRSVMSMRCQRMKPHW